MSIIKSKIRTIPDWPKPGIMFRDITSLLIDPEGLALTIGTFVARYQNAGITKVAGIEARGFITGAAVAFQLNVGFVPVRKKGKLPGETVSEEY
ncbi:MAG TPA: purine phosphoribosyltransferase family protein, partial [Leptospiraceae bacterium]|nr:purine phosphoribosyltransferase family protein [Leptospiraceae bacterium]